MKEKEKFIIALLTVYGPQPSENLIRIVYAGQTAFLSRQWQYLQRLLESLQKQDLIEHVEGKWQLCRKL